MSSFSYGYASGPRDRLIHKHMLIPSLYTIIQKDLGGAAPWDSESDRQKLKGSAIWHVDSVETAVLILHGENDKRVPVSQGISYFRGLRRRSAYPERAQLVIYPREPHG